MAVGQYEYTEQEWLEVELMARKAMPSNSRMRRAQLEEDFGGVDVHYIVNGRCPLAVRIRRNRPAYAADIDVTFRSTEPRKMAQRTYAPLALFVWLKNGIAVAGKLIDVYCMAAKVTPPLSARQLHDNHDGTYYLTVTVPELHATQALVRMGDRDGWVAACLGGNQRVKRIIENAG